jgi:hypothetical protein
MRRAALGLLALALPVALAAQAPSVTARGQVVRGPAATAMAGTMVVLHRIGRTGQGPMDSVRTDAAGHFLFRFPADTASLYILTARYEGIEYFSNPLATNPALPDTALALQVFDTSSTTPVHTEARHIVIAKPGDDGTRTVVEILVVSNPGDRTRVAADSLSSTWHALIPEQAIGFSAEDGDLSAGAVDRNLDSVLVLAPLAPGERQISIQYVMPAAVGTLTYRFDERINGINVLVEEPEATVTGGTLAQTDSVTFIQGRPFRHFNGVVDSGDVVVVKVPAPLRLARGWLIGLIALFGAALLAALVWALRGPRRGMSPHGPQPGAPDAPEALLTRLAQLDDQLELLPAQAEAERTPLLEERARIKAQLAEALARSRGGA